MLPRALMLSVSEASHRPTEQLPRALMLSVSEAPHRPTEQLPRALMLSLSEASHRPTEPPRALMLSVSEASHRPTEQLPRVILRNGGRTKSESLARRISRGVCIVAARCFGSAFLTSYGFPSQHDAAVRGLRLRGFFTAFRMSAFDLRTSFKGIFPLRLRSRSE